MILKQTDGRLAKYINKYGCYYMSLANAVGKEFLPEELNNIWNKAISLGYISGDMNNDGDMDDYNELLIVNANGLCKLLGAKLIYIDKHFPADTVIPDNTYAIGCFFNPANKFRHFVVIDKDKKVIYDPIRSSLTVQKGYLESIRLFKKYV